MKLRFSIAIAISMALGCGFLGDARAAIITALTSANSLVTINSTMPGNNITTVGVTGLTVGDVLVGIDYRPLDSSLIGLGYNAAAGTARVYSITSGGVATSINANTLNIGLNLNRVTADFNPTANALRIVTSATTGNNLRIPTGGTGVLTTDTDLNAANTGIRATAYSRNNAGGGTSGATTLYAIDGTNNSLVTQGSIDFFTGSGTSPNTGTLTAVAGLTGVVGSSVVGFEIESPPGTAAASPGNAFLATNSALFSLNLSTGAATSLGNFFTGTTVLDITAVPEPGSIALCGLAMTGMAFRFRRRLILKSFA